MGLQKKNVEPFFKDFVDYLNLQEERIKIEIDAFQRKVEIIACLKQTILKLMTEGIEEWKIINAPSPVDPDDRAIRWLVEKCLPTVARKYDIKWELIKAEEDKIIGLRYFCENPEVENDIVKPTVWAFEVASSRPLTGNQKTGGAQSG